MSLIYHYIPYNSSSIDGIIQYTRNQYINNLPITLTSSSLDTSTSRECIYNDDKCYFCSQTNCTPYTNTFTIEFQKSYFYLTGYIIKSDYTDWRDWYLTSWNLEGSIDNNNWDLLHSQTDVDTLSTEKGGSYQITNSSLYKYLRITQTGNTSSTQYIDAICRLRIRYFDFFGFISNRIIRIPETVPRICPFHISPLLFMIFLK